MVARHIWHQNIPSGRFGWRWRIRRWEQWPADLAEDAENVGQRPMLHNQTVTDAIHHQHSIAHLLTGRWNTKERPRLRTRDGAHTRDHVAFDHLRLDGMTRIRNRRLVHRIML